MTGKPQPIQPSDSSGGFGCPHRKAGYEAGLNGEYGQPPNEVRAGDRSAWHGGWDVGWAHRCAEIGEALANKLAQENSRKFAARLFGR